MDVLELVGEPGRIVEVDQRRGAIALGRIVEDADHFAAGAQVDAGSLGFEIVLQGAESGDSASSSNEALTAN